MARTVIPTVYDVTRAGVLADDSGADASYTAGDSVNDHQTGILDQTGNQAVFLHLVSTAGVSQDVGLVTAQQTVEGSTLPNRTITITAGSQQFLGPIAANEYVQPDGTVLFNLNNSSLKIKVFRLPVM